MAISQGCPVGQKFRRNRCLARFSRYKTFCVLHYSYKKLENSKWSPYLARQKLFENWDRFENWLLQRDTLWVIKVIEIALSSTVFEI